MGYGATFGILGGMAPLPPPPKSAYATVTRFSWYFAANTTVLFCNVVI